MASASSHSHLQSNSPTHTRLNASSDEDEKQSQRTVSYPPHHGHGSNTPPPMSTHVTTYTTNVNAYTPAETLEQISRLAVKKAHTPVLKAFMAAVSGGAILAFACATLVSTSSAPWFQENAPGLIKTIAALVFPYGLAIILLSGSDLCTTAFMYMTVASLQRRVAPWRVLRHWVITFFGNMAGSLFIVGIIMGYGGVFSGEAYRKETFALATLKQVTPQWHQIFLRAIGANWLVCMAAFLSFSARDLASKVIAIWWPTFAFVSLSLDHVIANMFFIPNAIFYGSPNITVGLYIWKGIIPALIGNIIGGGLFVGALFWFLHLQGEEDIAVDGKMFVAPRKAIPQNASGHV